MRLPRLLVLGVVYLGLTAAAGEVWGQQNWDWMEFPYRTAQGYEDVYSKKFFFYYDTSLSNCYNGTPWCIKTQCCGLNLAHWHFVENFTQAERENVARWDQYHHPQITMLLPPTTSFNCYSHATYGNSSVSLIDIATALGDDFVQVAGGVCDPYAVGQTCIHSGHASRISELNAIGGPPATAVKYLVEKRGGGGKWYTTPTGGGYGSPVAIYRTPWQW